MLRLSAFFRRHYWFWVLLLLFGAMRLLALLLFRPGGFFADNSDYEFYALWGLMEPSGYTTFQNLWTAYPPLFPAMMLPVFELSSRIPPWVEPRLFFHLLFGALLLVFEIGNLVLVYRLGNRLAEEGAEGSGETGGGDARGGFAGFRPGLLNAALYALMFAPLYTLLGWFEAMPLFFLLLGLDLLLVRRTWGWAGSAAAAALGFLVKLTPILLIPIAVRFLGAKLSFSAARTEWFDRRSQGNLLRPALYVLVFAAVTAVVGVWALGAGFDPQLALSSLRINAVRPPWQSVWALIDGYYGYGLVPIDMRNLQGLAAGDQWQTRIPWGVVGLAFAALYLWLYTRRYDWGRVRTPIVFAGVSIIWLFLYSKGWSPQFVVWILAFLVLLTPSLHAVVLAIALTLINFVESTIFLLVLPGEQWILAATVLARTLLLILLAVEWLGQIWPAVERGRSMQRLAARAAWGVLALALVVSLLGAPRAAQAYWERRTAEHPCREAITLLRNDSPSPGPAIVTAQSEVWRDFYPWLRDRYSIHILDGYDPNDRPAVEVMGEKLEELAAGGEFWWVEQGTGAERGSAGTSGAGAQGAFEWSPVLRNFAAQEGVTILEEQVLGSCGLARVVVVPPQAALATVESAGGPITLLAAAVGGGRPSAVDHRMGFALPPSQGLGGSSLPHESLGRFFADDESSGSGESGGKVLPVVLYWRAEEAVTGSYTVFTQLLDQAGNVVAQQDNLPVGGLAPTDTWRPLAVIRDPYQLALPPDLAPGDYVLHIGMYDAGGRRTLTLLDSAFAVPGTTADHLALPVYVD